jgi:hypothetical protein
MLLFFGDNTGMNRFVAKFPYLKPEFFGDTRNAQSRNMSAGNPPEIFRDRLPMLSV